MAERTADVQAHWTRPGVLARIDAALTELGHDPQNLNPEILATLEHLHSWGGGGHHSQSGSADYTSGGQSGSRCWLWHRRAGTLPRAHVWLPGRRHRPDTGADRDWTSADRALQACRPRRTTG